MTTISTPKLKSTLSVPHSSHLFHFDPLRLLTGSPVPTTPLIFLLRFLGSRMAFQYLEYSMRFSWSNELIHWFQPILQKNHIILSTSILHLNCEIRERVETNANASRRARTNALNNHTLIWMNFSRTTNDDNGKLLKTADAHMRSNGDLHTQQSN